MQIDLNCDLGESFGHYQMGNDREVIPLITSANIACGFHAGDENVMAETIRLAKKSGVSVGAHPGFPDKQGFGRRQMDMSLEEIYNLMIYQIGAIKTFCDINKIKLNHVKPHGALYQIAVRQREVANTIATAVYHIDPELYLVGLSNSVLIEAGKAQGLKVASEVFADRRYERDGQLVSRKKAGASIEDTEEAIEQVIRMVKDGKVKAITGEIIEIKADTICVHGDGAHALEFVKEIRSRLAEVNIDIVQLGG
ncbi:5-oxoprolinase subunit PxpA [Staphylococcus lutrae]|uniref:5-oxoprolinase subunit A n=1 Tax=Staphylococcus lutrae TaxID=155085 RepID=A0AAC9RMT1_9STAP|nr:5-oxoprolinase subunit PxpA [Staphylococcus lutrae]ARJ49911.1 lactam utilization protein LamB [Staphylococcus lutrae]PNZ38614.1 LamB/YcsF family protein [Staphylococcus lutrae]